MRWWWGGLVGLLSGFMVSQTLSLVAQWAADAGLCAACCPGSTVEGAATCGWHRLYDDSRLAWVAGWMKLLAVEAQSTSLQLFQDLRSWITEQICVSIIWWSANTPPLQLFPTSDQNIRYYYGVWATRQHWSPSLDDHRLTDSLDKQGGCETCVTGRGQETHDSAANSLRDRWHLPSIVFRTPRRHTDETNGKENVGKVIGVEKNSCPLRKAQANATTFGARCCFEACS